MEKTILTDDQLKIISAIGNEPLLKNFYLSGGTALSAYYLKHRFSDDLDFFIFKDPDKIFLHHFAERLKLLLAADELYFRRLFDRNLFIFKLGKQELKTEFTKYPFKQLAKSVIKNGIKIDSLRDIAANKFMTLLDRFDPKDFVDLFFLLKKFKLDKIRRDAEKKFNTKITDLALGSELSKVRHIEALPKMIKEISIKELKDFFGQQAVIMERKIFD